MQHTELASTSDVAGATLVMGSADQERMEIHGRYTVECIRDGAVVWVEEFDNLVTTVGKNDMLDKYLAGSAYTATARLSLKGSGAASAADTQASHAGWLEIGGANAPAYTGNRPTITFSAAAAGVKATSANATYAITSAGTVDGAFLNMNGSATKDDTTGILYSAGTFSGGARTVANGDTLNVSYSSTLT